MRKILISIILLFLTTVLWAQEISVKSFQLLGEDLTARINPVKNDNAQSCALVKIVTTEHGFEFDTDGLGMCKEVDESHAGEIWIWLSPGSRRITIRHKDLGVLRNYEYPLAIESARTYEMVLVTGRVKTIVEELPTTNFLALTVEPKEAVVKIDGNIENLLDGQFQKIYSVGTHKYEVFCDLYHPEQGSFTILPDATTTLSINMKPNYGFIKVISQPENDATVYINSRKVGTTPYASDKLASGTYTVQVAKEMFHNATKQVTVTDNNTTTVTLDMAPNFAKPTVTCADAEAEIWINGEKKGVGSWSGRLSAGSYNFEARKTAHRNSQKTLTLQGSDNGAIILDAPIPICGSLTITTSPFGADIILNGKNMGTTPKMLNKVLIGSYELKLQKQGCSSVTKNITVREGETVEISETLKQGREVTLNSDPTGASIYVDGSYVGIASLKTTLGFGTHTVRAEMGKVKKEQTINVTENGQSSWNFNVQQGFQRCGDKMKDYEGNEYNTVQIGKQCWMKENLKTTKYADGTSISQGSTTSYDVAYWYYPNGSSSNKATYGLLYNWKAVMRNSSSSRTNPSHVQGICPTGWHVPSDAEWTQLTDYVSSQRQYRCSSKSKYIAKALASTTGWSSYSGTCCVGDTPGSNNATGFSAVPAGYYGGSYYSFGRYAYLWSATESSITYAYYRGLYYNHANVYRGDYNKNYGFSVRCLRD